MYSFDFSLYYFTFHEKQCLKSCVVQKEHGLVAVYVE